jgi:polysaccharide transporter, PST family
MARLGYAVAALVASVIAARYLGAVEFGKLSFAQSLLMLCTPLVGLGLQSVAVTELVKNKSATLLGTVFRLQFLAASIALVVLLTWLGRSASSPVISIWICIPVILGLLAAPFETVEYKFQADGQPERGAWVRLWARLGLLVIQILIVGLDGSVYWFAASILMERVIQAACYSQQAMKANCWTPLWHFNPAEIGPLLKQSWPLLLSGLSVIGFNKMGEIIIGLLMLPTDVAQFSVASRISEAQSILPQALVIVLYPELVKKYGGVDYANALIKTLSIILYVTAVSALIIYALAPYLIVYVYGAQYCKAIIPLQVLCWNSILIGSGLLRGRLFVLENVTYYSLIQTVLACFLGLVLNCIMIPTWGIIGAALATTLSRLFLSYGTIILFPSQWGYLKFFHNAIMYPFVLVVRKCL